MDVDDLRLERVFERTERLDAPLFQRPYVWKRGQNWEPLWESIQTVAEKRVCGETVRPYFLGAIVLDQLKTPAGKINIRQIIDGQQRLTTLQLALAAARDLCQEVGQEKYRQAFNKLIWNDVPLSDNLDDVFKVWPTNADRTDFREVMTANFSETVRKLSHADREDEWLIPDAYLYFSDIFKDWLGKPEADERGFLERLDALYITLKDDLHMVVINLDKNDDAQVIFETLNALGTPLLPADLVKNFLFHLAESQNENTQDLYKKYWEIFDIEKGYWRKDVREGRLKRARLDIFLSHYLTLITGEDVKVAHLFSTFRDLIQKSSEITASKRMEHFRSYADIYQSFEKLPRDSREGVFFYRIQQMDTTTSYPLLLEVFKIFRTNGSREDLVHILTYLESFLVRRTVCELTSKSYNRFFVDIIKELRKQNDFSSTAISKFLISQTADTSRWPNDEEFKTSWFSINLYKRLYQKKIRMLLEAIDASLYTGKTEGIKIDQVLTIEHLMPIEWKEHWPLKAEEDNPKETDRATIYRESMIHKVGNLTLLTERLNPSVSNGPWTKKKKEILKHSAINLNRELQEINDWNEEEIIKRSGELFKHALKIWPYPNKV